MRRLIVTLALCLLPAAARAQDVRVMYDKGFTLKSDDDRFEVKLLLRTQTRLEAVRGLEDGAEFQSKVSIPRLRLQLEGFAHGADTGYKVELDLSNKGSPQLKDFFVDQAFGPVHLRAGQWKRPFNRQELISDFGSTFAERAITNEFSGSGRDLGVALHNDYERSPDGLEWAIGLFNGTGEKPTQTITCTPGMDAMSPPDCTTKAPSNVPGDFQPLPVVRVGWNHGGIKGYGDADLEGGPLRLAVGASYKVNLADLDADGFVHAAEVDGMIKVAGLDVLAAGFVVEQEGVDARFGALGQLGFMVDPKRLHLAGRFAMHQEAAGGGERLEARAAFTWFFAGHGWKWSTDAGVLDGTASGEKPTVEVRTQAQLAF